VAEVDSPVRNDERSITASARIRSTAVRLNGGLADACRYIGWMSVIGFIVAPLVGVLLLETSEDRFGHSEITPERMHYAMLCFALAGVLLVFRIGMAIIRLIWRRLR
jgi:hypothetical protein